MAGIDIVEFQGNENCELLVPTTYVVDSDINLILKKSKHQNNITKTPNTTTFQHKTLNK